MGVSADWNNGSKTLDITAGGARTAYAAETGKKQSGNVSVTLPSYKISVNGAQINNKEEKYPIFNYNGITYFRSHGLMRSTLSAGATSGML